jgi:hypothetical protein
MNVYCIAFWNLENLFAPEGFPNREPWIAETVAGDLRGWTDALFTRKIQQLAHGIRSMNDNSGPDLLGVCEVENRYVLDRLTQELNTLLTARRYDVIHADATSPRPPSELAAGASLWPSATIGLPAPAGITPKARASA